jgi:ATP-dependent Lon protease
LDLDFFTSRRKEFSIQEWIDFIVNSMGFNHEIYDGRQKLLLISRLIPMVEPRYNLVELAPKGTGKSFVFENMSRYVAVRSGAITAPVLFYNDARKTPGLITRFDCVVIDEAQKVKGDRQENSPHY